MAKVKLRVIITDENNAQRGMFEVEGDSDKAYSIEREFDVATQVYKALKPLKAKVYTR